MTRIILNGFSHDKFNLLDFYKKRVVRIFPALLVMILFFSVIVYFLLPTQFINYMRSAFSSSLFFSNIYYFIHTGYFDSSSQFNFLLHTWSLSVEWQFYLIYPLILLPLRKIYLANNKLFKQIFLALIAVSLMSMLIHTVFNPTFSFFIFYTRGWEMMFGGLAFLYEGKSKLISDKSKKIILLVCFSAILTVIVLVNSHTAIWPSLLTIIPVLATTLILLMNLDLKIFENKAVNFLGNISYSLYLWHWPLYVLSLFFAYNDRFRYKIIFIALSFLFAIISYYLIEKRNYNRRVIPIVFGSLLLSAICYSFTKIETETFFDKKTSVLSSANSKYMDSDAAIKQYDFNGKYFKHDQKFSEFDLNKLKTEPNKKYIILLGDSHAGIFAQTISNIVKETKCELIQVTADGTFPMYNSETDFLGPKEYFNYFFTSYFPKIKDRVELVILNSNYSAYKLNKLKSKINFTENYFKKHNTKILYIGQTKSFPVDFPTYTYIKNHYNIIPNDESSFVKKNKEADYYLKNRLGNKYIDLLTYNFKPLSDNGMPYIYDTNHLTYFGTEQYSNILRSFIGEK